MQQYSQQRIIAQRRRMRRRRKRIRAVIRIVFMIVILMGLLGFAKRISRLDLGNITWAGKNDHDSIAGYVEESDTTLTVPAMREGDAIREQIQKLAEKDSDYQEIYDHYEEYPQQLMLALGNNSEMLPFVQGYLDAGEPIICSMRPGNFTVGGHFIVLKKEVNGKIMVNDPNSRARSKVLWKYETLEGQIKNLWAFSR